MYCGQTVGWVKMPLGREICLGPGDIVFGGDPAFPWKWAQQPFTFRAMSVVAKQSPISATAELLSYLASSLRTYFITSARHRVDLLSIDFLFIHIGTGTITWAHYVPPSKKILTVSGWNGLVIASASTSWGWATVALKWMMHTKG